ncbi:PTS sugar transporter subunit IIC, partial [Bacillus cereus]|uniref:PTS sugar transporter subunit IIC n=1 Tax=Bacillus cereus TaxID=1396 RepID=UPI00164266C3
SPPIPILMHPLVNPTLAKIASIISLPTTETPIIMRIILAGLITLISTSPLSSIPLTPILPLTPLPIAIATLPLP